MECPEEFSMILFFLTYMDKIEAPSEKNVDTMVREGLLSLFNSNRAYSAYSIIIHLNYVMILVIFLTFKATHNRSIWKKLFKDIIAILKEKKI